MGLNFERASFILFLLLCICAWQKPDLAQNDFERLHDLRLTFAHFAILLGMAAVYAAQSKASLTDPPRRRNERWLWPIFVVALAIPPIGSRDVYYYLFYGRLWSFHHLNPYVFPPASRPEDPWFHLLNSWVSDYTMIYGPLFGLQMFVVTWASAGSIWIALMLQKLISLALIVLSAEWVQRLSVAIDPRSQSVALAGRKMWIYSPLVIFEGIVNGHNDLVMAFLILFSVARWLEGGVISAAVCLTLASLYKWYALILVLPLFVWESKRSTISPRSLLRIAAAVIAVATLVCLPYAAEWREILARSAGLDRQRMIFPWELSPPLWVLFQIFRLAGAFDLTYGAELFSLARLVIIATGLALVAWRSRAHEFDPGLAVRDCCSCLLLFFLFGPNQLWPWHFLPWCGLASSIPDARGRLAVSAVTAIALLSYFLTFILSAALVLSIALLAHLSARKRISAAD